MSIKKLPPHLQMLNEKIDQIATDISTLRDDVREIKHSYLTPECAGLMKPAVFHECVEIVDETANTTKPASFWEGYWSPTKS